MEQLLTDLIDEIWEWQMQEDPMTATFYGDHRYNDSLPSMTLEAIENQAQKNKAFLARLDEIYCSKLSSSSKVNYQILVRLLEDQVQQYEFKMHLMPISQIHGFHVYLPVLPNYTPLQTQEDYENYIIR